MQMSVGCFKSAARRLWNERNYQSSAGFQPRSPFHEEPINPCGVCVCAFHRGEVGLGAVEEWLKVDTTYICSPSCYGWAGIQVDTRRRCHPSVFPYRCAYSRGSCPCRWVPPLGRLVALWRKQRDQERERERERVYLWTATQITHTHTHSF